jgi:uncharacterized protein YndB with AHSA1/START domain
MRSIPRVLLTAGLVLAASACGVPIQSGAHFGRAWQPGHRLTFAWNDEEDHTQGDPRLQDNRFFHARLHEAVEFELAMRGIRYDLDNPDILIHHHLSLADHDMEREIVDEAGTTTTQVETYEGGSVVVHLEDARTGDDLWVGWAQASIEVALVSPNAMRDWVYDLVGKMFEDWPVASPSDTSGSGDTN